MESREIIRRLEADGWYRVARVGSHIQFKHAAKPGRVTVPIRKKTCRPAPCAALSAKPASPCGPKEDSVDYIAVIHKDADSDWGVSFPDFPGCVTAGETLEEARRMAAEALALHVRGLAEDGLSPPRPMALDAVPRHPDFADGVAVLVSLPEARPKNVRVNVMLPQADLEAIDARAREEGVSRSSFLLRAARAALTGPGAGCVWNDRA